MQTDRVTVVVPTYNERENLPLIAEAIRSHGYRLVIVDDGSPDGTGQIADALSDESPDVSVIHRAEKAGLGPAYGQGFGDVIAGGQADYIVQMDADFSHDPASIPDLVSALDSGADLAIGSRYVPGGAVPDWPLIRRLISRGGNVYAAAMLGVKVKDATAGFRAWRREALSAMPYRQAEASGYGFQVEMAWRAEQAGLTIVEVPITFRDRTRGTSKMDGKIVIEAMGLVTRWGVGRLFGRARKA